MGLEEITLGIPWFLEGIFLEKSENSFLQGKGHMIGGHRGLVLKAKPIKDKGKSPCNSFYLTALLF